MVKFREPNFEFQPGNYSAWDWTTLLITVLLVTIGLMSIFSATYGSSMSSFFDKQLQSAFIGFVAMITLMFVPERIIRLIAYPIYGISIILLVLVLFIGIESHGTKGWLRFAGQTIQPSEVAKLGTLLSVSAYLSQKGVDIHTWRDLGICLLIIALPAFLILKQPDFGTASVLPAMMFGILFWTGFSPLFLYFLIAIPFIIIASLKGMAFFVVSCIVLSILVIFFNNRVMAKGLVIGIFVIMGFVSPLVYDNLMPHQQARIETFLNPGSNPLGAGYNVIQSVMAVGSGGLFGKGYLQGTQTQLRYIPMQWTDFIFSVPNEEFGFIGGSLVVILLGLLIIRAARMGYETDSKFMSIICIGTASVLLYHSIINIGMVIELMPVMGIPLPFMSYGGTSLLFNMSLVGLLLNAYRTKRINRMA